MSEKQGAFAPFRHAVFTVMWVAILLSNIGTWVFNVTSGWLMTDLAPSPLMVSLVQAATSLPVFLFALPAGALGDLFDRRRLLLVTQVFSAVVMFAFAALLWQGAAHAWVLLLFTFMTGVGAAFATPAFQAITSQLVPKNALAPAIALNGVSINVARAIGPALGSLILASFGAVATVALNGMSFIIVIVALLWWRATSPQGHALPRERMAGAMRAGLRFALFSTPLSATLVRALAFFIFASAYWALLPLIARDLLQGGPGTYGVLLTMLGLGAFAGAAVMPVTKSRFGLSVLTWIANILTAAACAIFALGGSVLFGVVAAVFAGMGWIMMVSALNTSAHTALPDWVRTRGLAVFQMAFFGAMTAGSLLWGQVGAMFGLSQTLLAVAGLLLVVALVVRRYELGLGEGHNYDATRHWPEPVSVTPIEHDRGPVMITIEYVIRPDDMTDFAGLMHQLGRVRRRDGAMQWGYFEDIAFPGKVIEMFTVESWVEHLRQHDRVSVADKALQNKIIAYHQGTDRPIVTHAIRPDGRGHVAMPAHHQDV